MILKELSDVLLRDPRAIKRIAKDAGVDKEVTAAIAAGRPANPMLGTLEKLCKALGVRIVIEQVEAE